MAGSTNAIRPAVVGIEPGMVKRCTCPVGRRMAECASRGKARGNMVRIVRSLILRLVAAITIGGQGRVIVIYVTIRARDLGVETRQRKRSIVVIEGCRRPRGGAVTHVALLREPRGGVVRVIRILVVRQMAAHACSTSNSVVPIRMALAALQRRMKTSERPTGCCVIEGGRSPVRGAVTHFTLLRDSGGDVIRVVRSLKIFPMATHARGVADVVVPVDVALSALHLGVRSSERKRGLRVVERCWLPSCSRVAHLALLGHTGGQVVRIRCALVVLEMA